MKKSFLKMHVVSFSVAIVRVAQALMIPFFPVVGYIIAVFLDVIDCHILRYFGNFTSEQYHTWDKVVDLLVYIFVVVAGYQYSEYGWVFLLFFLHRMIATFIFIFHPKPILFVIFPNLLEVAFVLLVATVWWPTVFESEFILGSTFLIFVILKLIHEYILHSIWDRYFTPYFTKIRKNYFHISHY